MTDTNDLSPEPLPPVEPHYAGVCARHADGRMVVTCPDCCGAEIGVAHDEEEAVDVVALHAREMEK